MGWTRTTSGLWIVPCRDVARRRRVVVVRPTEDGRVALVVPPGEVAVLELLAAGRLRGALRDIGQAMDGPATAQLRRHEIAVAR